jgi:hypothetical protein
MRRLRNGIFLLIVLVLLAAAVIPNFIHVTDCGPLPQTIHNVHFIQAGLERYYLDHQVYPPEVSTLTKESYLPKSIDNAYFRRPKLAMKDVRINASEYLGNFSYVPMQHDGKITEYLLFGYGRARTEKHLDRDAAWRHVIVCLHDRDGVPICSPFPGGGSVGL